MQGHGCCLRAAKRNSEQLYKSSYARLMHKMAPYHNLEVFRKIRTTLNLSTIGMRHYNTIFSIACVLTAWQGFVDGQRSPDDPLPRFVKKQFKIISGQRMAYVDVGTGDPIVFLHGNPTSSYLWRNVMPHVEGLGRLIAPDLIGMGDSDKISLGDPLRYSFVQHSNFLYQLLEQLDVKERITFVIHDWGSALGFLWAFYNRFNPRAVKGIAFMEAIVSPFESLESIFGASAGVETFRFLRGPGGEEVLQNNLFVEEVLPSSIIRNLTKKELEEYRRPFLRPGEDRRPTLTWPRQIPIGGVPADVDQLVRAYSKWLGTSTVPKLFIKGEPGLILVRQLADLARSWPNVKEVAVKGIHFLQEDSPDEIGMAIAEWLSKL